MPALRRAVWVAAALLAGLPCFCWGFFAHRKINYYAVFLLPPGMLPLYKPHIGFLSDHAVDPDRRRYAVAGEAPRHYLDLDHYGTYPFDSLPRNWKEAVQRYSEDTLARYGTVPWWIQTVQYRLTEAFREKHRERILRLSAELGHYVADAHVPLHATQNHNGQRTGQHGIHGFWESRIPELLADREWDFLIGKADYIPHTGAFIWQRLLESAAAADTVLQSERELARRFPPDEKYAFEMRAGKLVRQYSTAYTRAYNARLQGMVERRMRQSIHAVASLWYTAWVNAGQPDLGQLAGGTFTEADLRAWQALQAGSTKDSVPARDHERP